MLWASLFWHSDHPVLCAVQVSARCPLQAQVMSASGETLVLTRGTVTVVAEPSQGASTDASMLDWAAQLGSVVQ